MNEALKVFSKGKLMGIELAGRVLELLKGMILACIFFSSMNFSISKADSSAFRSRSKGSGHKFDLEKRRIARKLERALRKRKKFLALSFGLGSEVDLEDRTNKQFSSNSDFSLSFDSLQVGRARSSSFFIERITWSSTNSSLVQYGFGNNHYWSQKKSIFWWGWQVGYGHFRNFYPDKVTGNLKSAHGPVLRGNLMARLWGSGRGKIWLAGGLKTWLFRSLVDPKISSSSMGGVLTIGKGI